MLLNKKREPLDSLHQLTHQLHNEKPHISFICQILQFSQNSHTSVKDMYSPPSNEERWT
jgi:hypothetical protein